MPPKISFKVSLPSEVKGIIYNTLKLLENHFRLTVQENPTEGLVVSDTPEADIPVSKNFINAVTFRHFDHHDLMKNKPLIFCEDGRPDYIGTCAYMVNFLQEYVSEPEYFDDLQRFKYEKSYQYRFSCVTKNLVLEYLIRLKENCRKLKHIQRKIVSSELRTSHDIDYLYHNRFPDLKTAFKHLNILQIFEIMTRPFKDPDEEIFDRILAINNTYPVKPIFFWLASQEKHITSSGKVIDNANYSITSPKVRQLMEKIRLYNCEMGVHQSLGCRDLTSERNRIDPAISINRNHYLAGKLPDVWARLERADIERDATAGFSEAMGFRNSYGYPVRPFDPIGNRLLTVIEYPLHIMDATFMNQNLNPNQALDLIKEFLSKHPSDCQISILWHNNYFSKVKFAGWIKSYEKILEYWSKISR